MSQGDGRRHCVSCRAWLARDNLDRLCSPCQSSDRHEPTAPPDVPADFWQDADMRAALESRHIGRVIRAYRRHPHHGPRAVSQDDIAVWAGLAQGQVSKIETGAPINRLDRLIFWAQLLGIPEDLLWFKLPDDGHIVAGWPPAGRIEPVIESWAASTGLGRIMNRAADTSLRFLAMATETNVTDALLDELRWEVGRIAVDYVHAPLTTLLHDLVVVRDVVFDLLQKRQAPRHSCDLYLLAGTTCAMLANASHNVGDLRSALVQVRAAFTCADLADHDGLRAWTRGTAAVIAEWSLRPEKAIELAVQGATYPASPQSRARLAAIEARAAARTNDRPRALAAIERLEDVSGADGVTDDITAIGGVLSFPGPKKESYLGTTYGLLGEHQAAERHALAAITSYESGPPTNRSYGDEALARVDLANARLAVRDLGGAHEALAPVLSLTPERRIRQLDAAIGRTRVILERRPLAHTRDGRELLARITDEYDGAVTAPAALAPGVVDVG